MADEKCSYFYTAKGERYLCKIKEERWGGRDVPNLSVLECDSCDFTTCSTYQRRVS